MMKQKNIINSLTIFIVFIVVFVANTNFVLAVPMPRYFVINEQAKQCGVYWGGDEFSQYELPIGWKIYEPIRNLTLKTPYGTCNGDVGKQYYQGCAQQIGFKYVDYKKVPYTTSDVSKFNEGGWKCGSQSGKSYYQGFLVNETSKELTTLINFSLFNSKTNRNAYPTEGQCTITDKNWVAYEYLESSGIYESKIVTPFGECNSKDDKSCCSQLGLTDVGENLTEENNSPKKKYLAIIDILISVSIAIIFGLILFKKYR